jgi:integrase
LRIAHKTATFQTLFGVLAATGMRVGEAVGLDRSDFDADTGTLTVRNAKFGKSRELPLHPTTTSALTRYLHRRDRPQPIGATEALLLSAGVMGACSALRSLSAQKCSAVEMPRAGGALFGERMQKSGRATYRCPAGGFGGCLAGCANRGGRSGVGRCVVG